MARKKKNESHQPYLDDLKSTFGIPIQGSVILYSDIDSILGFSRAIIDEKGRRFNDSLWLSIIKKWRDELETKHNVILKVITNVGYECISSSKRIEMAGYIYLKGIGFVRKSNELATTTDISNLTKQEHAVRNHLIYISGKFLLMADKYANKVKFPTTRPNRQIGPYGHNLSTT